MGGDQYTQVIEYKSNCYWTSFYLNYVTMQAIYIYIILYTPNKYFLQVN